MKCGYCAILYFIDAEHGLSSRILLRHWIDIVASKLTDVGRTLVQEGIAPKFIEALKAQFEGFSHAMGDTMSPNTFLGPLADKGQYDRVMGFLEEGKKDGANVLVGGSRKGDKGLIIFQLPLRTAH